MRLRAFGCQVFQPSASIIDISLVVFGFLILLAAYSLWQTSKPRALVGLMIVAGVGGILNGIFSETAMTVHLGVALIFNISAALAAIAAFSLEDAPLRYFSVAMGLTTLAAIMFLSNGTYLGLGPGGIERMAAYPILLWTIGFGGYLMGRAKESFSRNNSVKS